MDEMRRYIRHPLSIPLEVTANGGAVGPCDYLKDISHGGLAFHSQRRFPVNHQVRVRMPSIDAEFETTGVVVWCKGQKGGYDVGLRFKNESEAYRLRLLEQMSQIEQYRSEINGSETRDLNSEQAAAEWIGRYAKEFAALWEHADAQV